MATKKATTTTTKAKEEVKAVETKAEKAEKRYFVLTATTYPMSVTKEQYEEIKKSSNVIETEENDIVFARVL